MVFAGHAILSWLHHSEATATCTEYSLTGSCIAQTLDLFFTAGALQTCRAECLIAYEDGELSKLFFANRAIVCASWTCNRPVVTR